MIRQTHISIAISVALHIIVFLILAGVKLYTEIGMVDEMPVTFVNEQKTIPLRRSSLVRPMVSLDESPRRHSPQQYVVNPEYRSAAADFYVDSSVKVFSEVKSAGKGILQDADIQRPSVQLNRRFSVPMSADFSNKPHLRGTQIQPRVSEGRDFLTGMATVKTKPDANIIDGVLRKFFSAVRGRIESRKKYPIAAQKAEIEGRAGVRIVILKDGRLEKAEIVESSGYKILDAAALRSVENAEPFPPIPSAVKLGKIEINIHLVFKLSRRM